MDEVKFRATQSPSPAKYSGNTKLEAYKSPRVTSYIMVKPGSGAAKEERRVTAIKKDDKPSPNMYKTETAYFKCSKAASSQQYSIARSPRRTMMDETITRAKKSPSAAHYNIEKADKRIVRGSSKISIYHRK